MKCRCHDMSQMGEGHPPLPHHGPCHHGPHGRFMLAPVMLGYLVTALCLTWRLTKALEIMALVQAMDKMDDRLTEMERADLNARVRKNLFS